VTHQLFAKAPPRGELPTNFPAVALRENEIVRRNCSVEPYSPNGIARQFDVLEMKGAMTKKPAARTLGPTYRAVTAQPRLAVSVHAKTASQVADKRGVA